MPSLSVSVAGRRGPAHSGNKPRGGLARTRGRASTKPTHSLLPTGSALLPITTVPSPPPRLPAPKQVFKKYVDAVTRLNEPTFDVVLIDGRARVACALKVLPYLSPTSTVILHDARRTAYAALDDWYDEVGLVVGDRGTRLFRRKASVVAQLPLSDATIHAAYAPTSRTVAAQAGTAVAATTVRVAATSPAAPRDGRDPALSRGVTGAPAGASGTRR